MFGRLGYTDLQRFSQQKFQLAAFLSVFQGQGALPLSKRRTKKQKINMRYPVVKGKRPFA